MVQKNSTLVDLVESFPTNIFLQKLASIQERTVPIKFAHLSEKGSIANLSTKGLTLHPPTSTNWRQNFPSRNAEVVVLASFNWRKNARALHGIRDTVVRAHPLKNAFRRFGFFLGAGGRGGLL